MARNDKDISMIKLESLLDKYYTDYGILALDFNTYTGKLVIEVPENRCDNINEVVKRLETQLNSLIKLYRITSDTTQFTVEYKVI